MASPSYKIHENTAASLLHYASYNKPGPGGTTEQCWTRFSSVNEGFNVAEAGGLRYLIRFDANFSKKHLATFSKKEWRTEEEKWLQSQKPGQQGKDGENWNNAQKQLLDAKILKILGIRNPVCACGHLKKPDLNAMATTGHSNTGICKHAGCGCAGFAAAPSAYVAGRTAKNKPDVNPLAGAPTNQSSCIVLNWIPANEFERVVGNSIKTVEDAHALANAGNPVPDTPLVAGAHLTDLTWRFAGRPGAVRHAANGTVDVENGNWCSVGARKLTGGPGGITSTWTIVHWVAQGFIP
jgi:hypothetical protein